MLSFCNLGKAGKTLEVNWLDIDLTKSTWQGLLVPRKFFDDVLIHIQLDQIDGVL